jgi:hypothetical protein
LRGEAVEVILVHLVVAVEVAPGVLDEARVIVDDKAFLELCKTEYANLSESGKSLLMMNMTRLVPSKDSEILKGMSEFIRSNLATSTPNVIMLSGRLLQSIEEGFKKN